MSTNWQALLFGLIRTDIHLIAIFLPLAINASAVLVNFEG